MSPRSTARRARPKRRRLTAFGALSAATAVGLASAPASMASEPIQTGRADGLTSLRAPGQVSGQLLAGIGQGQSAATGATAGMAPLGSSETLYTVRAGDTVSHIALRYGTTVARIISQNDLNTSAAIRVGQVLRIGGASTTTASTSSNGGSGSSSNADSTTHTVRAGDTVWSLARKHNTSVSAIISANSLGSNAMIRIGQRLTIPGSNSSGGSSSSSGSSNSGSATSHGGSAAAPDTDLSVGSGTDVSVIAAGACGSSAYSSSGGCRTTPGSNTPAASPSARGSSNSGSATPHTVRPCETVWPLALRYGTNASAIISANNLGSNAMIRIGQRLTIPGSNGSGGSSSSSGSSSSGGSGTAGVCTPATWPSRFKASASTNTVRP